MQTPYRKKETYVKPKVDPNITPEKFAALTEKLRRMKEVDHPRLSEEVKHLASMGDFSENAGYQLAKGRLRGLNQRIAEAEDLLKRAEVIMPDQDKSRVGLGHTVTVETNGKTKVYRILGSTETDPLAGIISHNSPLGAALLGHRPGETAQLEIDGRTIEYKIIKIE